MLLKRSCSGQKRRIELLTHLAQMTGLLTRIDSLAMIDAMVMLMLQQEPLSSGLAKKLMKK